MTRLFSLTTVCLTPLQKRLVLAGLKVAWDSPIQMPWALRLPLKEQHFRSTAQPCVNETTG